MPKKKPDLVVFNEESNTYDASLKPYPTNLGAPAIEVLDTSAWKNRSISKVNHKLKSKFAELKIAYDAMIAEYDYNKMIYASKFSFEPIVGQVYHLYKRTSGENFLSIISPSECTFDLVGSFYLNAEQIWQKHVDETP